MMDFFDQRRYRINKFFLSCFGLWPFQSRNKRHLYYGSTIFFLSTVFTFFLRKPFMDIHNVDILMETVPALIVDAICVIKFLTSIFNTTKIHAILIRIKKDMEAPMGPEKDILVSIADEGRTYTIIYTVGMYFTCTSYSLQPMVPKIIVALGLANISAPAQFPYPVDYIVDHEKYYFYIQLHICIGVLVIVSIIISVDTMFVVNIQHACAIFGAIDYRLRNLVDDDSQDWELYPNRLTDEPFWIVIDCIKKHNRAIQFTEIIDGMYSWSFFFTVGLNMLILSFSGFQAALNLANNQVEELIIQIVFTGSQFMHLLFESFFSQRLTNYSHGVYEALNQVRWYKTSMRTRKLLNFMRMRSSVPIELKAGKIYVMSMENFSAVVRTSMSYFTIICSMQ